MTTSNKIEYIKEYDDQILIKRNNIYYKVGALTYEILVLYEQEKSPQTIQSIISSKHGTKIDELYIRNIINKFNFSQQRVNKQYIKGKIKLINLQKIDVFLNFLTITFSKTFVVFCFLFFFILLFYLKIFEIDKTNTYNYIHSNYSLYLVFLMLSFIISIIHEFGHSVACRKFNVQPKEIGFGFYLFFPVMFTDVSSSWELEKKQRLIIDLAGFYFQVITMVVIMIVMTFFDSFNTLGKIIVYQNIILIIYNLNPLFRFDGYWILSDLFNITNLRQKSSIFIKDFILNVLRFIQNKPLKKKNVRPIIYWYSIISNLFIIFVFICFFRFSFKVFNDSYLKLFGFFVHKIQFDWIDLVIRLGSVSIGLYFTLRSIKNKINNLLRK